MASQDRAEEFILLLANHERQIGGYVMTLVPHRQDADDILQEAKLIMWRQFPKFTPGTNFGAWARKIAFHQVLNFRKRKQRDRLDFSDDFLRVVAEEVDGRAEELQQRERALQDCIQRLPTEHRTTLHLRYQDGLSLEEMETRLGRTTCALYRLLSRIRQTLHECVSKSVTRENNEPA